jgi:hypothetical protein
MWLFFGLHHTLKMLKPLRERINRDDGCYFQVGNRQVGNLEAIGLLFLVLSFALWQFQEKAGLDILWALGFGSGGFLIYILHVFLTIRRNRPLTASAEINR